MRKPSTFIVLSVLLCANALGQADTSLVFALQGNVYDKDTGLPLAGSKITVVGTDGSNFNATADRDGAFTFDRNDSVRFINKNTTYSILAEKEGYLVVKDQLSTVGLGESTTFVKEYFLQPPPVCGPWIYPILFAKNTFALTPAADSTIALLKWILIENPNLVLEIIGHCDEQEKPAIGESRSEMIRAELVAGGITFSRLVATSRGSLEPVVSSDQIARMTSREDRKTARALNRRVDYKVIRTDWHP
ncbi:MAG TPA: OmpA family protein [Flavobacteriales bacterium]|nr:OmpA family protein [Flavobacteriales bacterium]